MSCCRSWKYLIMVSYHRSYLDAYKQLLRFSSVSADPTQKQAVASCAEWIYNFLVNAGVQKVKLVRTKMHPLVYGEFNRDPSYKTILFYGHYDVQPTGPHSQWKYPPFEPVIHDNYMYARGASDDKGQLFIQLMAIKLLLKNSDRYRVNIKCIYEGEEETGSQHLGDFVHRNRQLIKSDVVVVSDTKMCTANRPAITYSLRGSINAELSISNRARDLHSGTFGGMVYDPAFVLSKILGQVHGSDGRICIPGFYDSVEEYSRPERSFMQRSGPNDGSLLAETGAASGFGEPGYSNYERTTIRPSIVITGLFSGHTGAGFKNSISPTATAKINMRLAGRQNPQDICRLFHLFVRRSMPKHCFYTMRFSSLIPPVETDRYNVYLNAAARAYEKIFRHPVVFLRSGGTIPVVSLLQKEMGIPIVLMGFALAGDNMHAPDERFYLPTIERGIHTLLAFAKQVGTL